MFKTGFATYACIGDSIECAVNGLTAKAMLFDDDCQDAPDKRDDGFWPSANPDNAGYVTPDRFAEAQAEAEEVMAAWKNDRWRYVGVCVRVYAEDIALTDTYAHALWGVECNYPGSDNSYLLEVANELLPEALEAAKARLLTLCDAIIPNPAADFVHKVAALGDEGAYDDAIDTLDALIIEARQIIG